MTHRVYIIFDNDGKWLAFGRKHDDAWYHALAVLGIGPYNAEGVMSAIRELKADGYRCIRGELRWEAK